MAALSAELLRFLKSVSAVELWEFPADESGPEQRFGFDVDGCEESCKTKRASTRLSTTDRSDPMALEGVKSHVDLRIVCKLRGADPEGEAWLVRQSTGSSEACRLCCDVRLERFRMKLMPWGGVAALGGSAVKGRAFLLPLPTLTGLPIYT